MARKKKPQETEAMTEPDNKDQANDEILADENQASEEAALDQAAEELVDESQEAGEESASEEQSEEAAGDEGDPTPDEPLTEEALEDEDDDFDIGDLGPPLEMDDDDDESLLGDLTPPEYIIVHDTLVDGSDRFRVKADGEFIKAAPVNARSVLGELPDLACPTEDAAKRAADKHYSRWLERAPVASVETPYTPKVL